MSLQLYFAPGACSFVPHAMLEIAGAAFLRATLPSPGMTRSSAPSIKRSNRVSLPGRKLGIHAQSQYIGCDGGQLPKVTVAQAAIFVQAHFNDAWVKACVQKVTQPHQHASQNAPIDSRRAE